MPSDSNSYDQLMTTGVKYLAAAVERLIAHRISLGHSSHRKVWLVMQGSQCLGVYARHALADAACKPYDGLALVVGPFEVQRGVEVPDE
jgi:hypothetical protein